MPKSTLSNRTINENNDDEDDEEYNRDTPGHSVANEDEDEEEEEQTFDELLKTHSTQMIWGFQFGEASRRTVERKCLEINNASDDDDSSNSDEELIEMAAQSSKCDETDHRTPHSIKRKSKKRHLQTTNRKTNDNINTNKTIRHTPLPIIDFGDNIEIWNFMIYREEATLSIRNTKLYEITKNLTPRMRTILFDWLMEVCSVYHLRRVTYYLSIDYFDRFISIRSDITKNQLQLIGITCLFIAAKVEEIYPPNIQEFSYICDGACTIDDILACELLILNSLGWEVIQMTPTDWLNLYMQLHFKTSHNDAIYLYTNELNNHFIYPQYSGYQFIRASQLIDLFSMDSIYLKYRYSVIAASAMYFMYGQQVALDVSGLNWSELSLCVDYMGVFFDVIKHAALDDPLLKSYPNGNNDDNHNMNGSLKMRIKNIVMDENFTIQTHVANMKYFEQATILRLSQITGKFDEIKRLVKESNCHDHLEKSDENDDENTNQMIKVIS